LHRYDDSDSNWLVTGGSVDGTVKVWDVSNGALKTTLKGGSSNAIIDVDIAHHFVAGGGSDKTCRVWNFHTNHLVHHLVGHVNKITSIKFFGFGGQLQQQQHGIATAAADRQIKVWDISRQTYQLLSTLQQNSTANSIDIGIDSYTLGSGHTTGGISFWDMRTGKESATFDGM
jgi:WD40 repeat protein